MGAAHKVGSFSPLESRVSRCPGWVAAWGQLPERSPGCWPQEREQASTQRGRQRRQRVSAGFSCVFLFLERVAETRCFCCWGRPPVLFPCLGGQRNGPSTGGAQTGAATFLDPGGRSREAQRSGFSPWKRSFCSSGQDRNKTVSCRGHLAFDRFWSRPALRRCNLAGTGPGGPCRRW